MEDLERKKRIEKATRLEKSYELLRLCRETLKAEGETWQISKARRELEREKTEKDLERKSRIERAKSQKENTLKKIENKNIQTKITEKLKEIPENRKFC